MMILSALTTLFIPQNSSLSLEEKVGQMLMVHCHTEEGDSNAKALINEVGVGSIIYYNWANNLSNIEEVKNLSGRLQQLSQDNPLRIPLLIATDQEGGVVMRCQEGDFTSFPGNAALGMTGNPSLARKSAEAMGKELQACGINMNLAPVVDINANPNNPVIGIRSFGNLDQVLTYSPEALRGYHEANIITTAKHFPDHGNTGEDSHIQTAVVKDSLTELKNNGLRVFGILAKDTDAIMPGHLRVIALDPDICATLSPKVISYLRKNLDFNGIVITDSLTMEGLLAETDGSIDEAAIRSIEAGCDIILLGGKLLSGDKKGFELSVEDIKRVQKSVVKAVKDGRISEDAINVSVNRILDLKSRYITSLTPPNLSTEELKKHQELAKEIARLALRQIPSHLEKPLSLSEKKVTVIAPLIIQKQVESSSLLTLGKENRSFFYENLNCSQMEQDSISNLANETDILIVCSYNAWKNPGQKQGILSLLAKGKPVVIIALRDPMDGDIFPEAVVRFMTYSPSTPSIEAVCDSLKL